jgi:hypothetical protein
MSFVSSGAIALVAASTSGVSAVFAAVSANLALFWLAALLVAAGRGERAIPVAMLAMGAMTLPALLYMAGGLASPLSVLLAALVVEPVWAARNAGGQACRHSRRWTGGRDVCGSAISCFDYPLGRSALALDSGVGLSGLYRRAAGADESAIGR